MPAPGKTWPHPNGLAPVAGPNARTGNAARQAAAPNVRHFNQCGGGGWCDARSCRGGAADVFFVVIHSLCSPPDAGGIPTRETTLDTPMISFLSRKHLLAPFDTPTPSLPAGEFPRDA